MNIIKENPFRILGLTGNATERELQRQLAKIKAFSRVGKEIKLDYDLNFLGEIERNEEAIQRASSQIEQANKKIIYSLFWFINKSKFDEIALKYLKDNQVDKAIEIWEKTLKNEISQKNCSSYQNLSSLFLAKSINNGTIDLEYLTKGISLKKGVLLTDYIYNFSKLVAGDNLTTDKEKINKAFIDEIIELLKPYKLPANKIIELFNQYPPEIKKHVANKFIEIPISNIENNIEKTKRNRKENPVNAYKFAKRLYENTNDDLKLLKNILGKNSIQYRMLSDKIANEILQCSIDFFNKNQEENYDEFDKNLNKSIKLVKLASSIAIGEQVKDRANENLNTLNRMKSRIIDEAIALLQSVKEAYENACKKIDEQVSKIIGNGDDIFSRLRIDWEQVERLKKDAIDWVKVNEILENILDNTKLKVIKLSSSQDKKIKFIDLLYWLQNNSQHNYLVTSIIKKYKKIPPKLPFKIISSEITNKGKPLYTKFIRYIGLKLNIKPLEEKTITFFLKYIDPDGSINRSKSSPERYTFSTTKKINNKTTSIELPGWGNSEECTYDIGKHKIEVYVDEYLIHTKEFVVDLAPSEKIMKELEIAEKKLNKILNTEYFESAIQNAKLEMENIKKFQLFRSKSTKEKQIAEQQKKIDELINQAKIKKEKMVKQQNQIIYELKSKLKQVKY